MPGTPAHAPDFNDVFCRLAAEGCRYREITAPLIMGTADARPQVAEARLGKYSKTMLNAAAVIVAS
jgi:hypothetical protein